MRNNVLRCTARLVFAATAFGIWPGLAVAGDGPKANAAAAAAKPKLPEAVEMAVAIVSGSKMGPHDGWFHDAELAYGWPWLASKFDRDGNGAVAFEEFNGPEALFDRLDRDRDGDIKASDLDWSDRSPFYQQAGMSSLQFRKFDMNGDGRIERGEWAAFFDRAAGAPMYLAADDFREALAPTMPRRRPAAAPPTAPPASASAAAAAAAAGEPTMMILLKGLIKSEIGSPYEGPHVGMTAPDFTLKTRDGKETVTLSRFRGKPVVLVFGNITCGPFRVRYPNLERLQKRYGDKVQFLAIYVREAHPTGGWRMEMNDRVGVVIDQPADYATRASVADRACSLLKTTMPMLVDEIDDRVGHAYSGMPSRLYVIDPSGKVTYKSGRGPFGFKSGEMEQSLVMTLLDAAAQPAAPAVTNARN
jgi:thiol-disulfide isomerase/thioredoxin